MRESWIEPAEVTTIYGLGEPEVLELPRKIEELSDCRRHGWRVSRLHYDGRRDNHRAPTWETIFEHRDERTARIGFAMPYAERWPDTHGQAAEKLAAWIRDHIAEEA